MTLAAAVGGAAAAAVVRLVRVRVSAGVSAKGGRQREGGGEATPTAAAELLHLPDRNAAVVV